MTFEEFTTLLKERKERLEYLIRQVEQEVEYVGIKPYSHNLVSLGLGQIAEEFGNAEANKVIEINSLESLGWSKVD